MNTNMLLFYVAVVSVYGPMFGSLCKFEEETKQIEHKVVIRRPLVCPKDWVPFQGKKCFGLFHLSSTFDEARSHCAGLGATLASIESQAEADLLNAVVMKRNELNHYWLGGFRVGASWAWDDLSPFVFTNWQSGQPDNMGEGEHCVEGYFYQGEYFGLWNDRGCDNKRNFFCQLRTETDLEVQCSCKC